MAVSIEVGQPAPDFTLPDHRGDDVTLSELQGSPVVVYFYPRSDTPGCTTQACDIRDRWSEFEAAGARVLGISPDDVETQAKFVDKHALPHTILADPDAAVLREYGAWGEKKMYGKVFEGAIRSTVLVDANGVIAAVWPKVKPNEHADAILAAIAELDD